MEAKPKVQSGPIHVSGNPALDPQWYFRNGTSTNVDDKDWYILYLDFDVDHDRLL